MKRLAEAEIHAKAEKEIDEVIERIVDFFTANKTNMSVLKPALEICKEHGYSNPKEIDDISVAKKVLAVCK